MKTNLLLFLLLLLVLPSVSIGAETRTLEVEFSFNAKDTQGKKVSGYRLYKEGKKVCETNKPNVFKMSCTVLIEKATPGFTLAAYYSNGTESPKSASFPLTINSTQSINFKWTLKDSAKNAGGFRIYENGVLLYKTSDSSAREATYESKSSKPTFTISALDSKGKETYLPANALTHSVNTKPTAVLSSSTAAGIKPLTVTFDGSSSKTPNSPLVSYNWLFGDGSKATGKTASHVFTKAGTYYTKLTVKDSKGLTDTATTPIIVTEAVAKNNNASNISLDFEVGEVSIDHKWVRVLFQNTFKNPVVVAGPPTSNGSDPVLVRVRNVDQKGFEIRLQEWDYLDGIHIQETFSYIVMEKGTFTLSDGTKVEAGNFTGSNQFKKVSLQQPYNVTPVILTQVLTNKDTAAVTGRVGKINQSSFEYKLQEQEKTHSAHATESIGYIAWQPGKGQLPGLQYEVGTKSVPSNWSNLSFQTGFPDMPLFIAGMQTYNGGDTAAIRTQNMAKTAIKVKIEEEKSKDTEIGHTAEAVGYLAIGSAKK
jgi:PKD repeat protein